MSFVLHSSAETAAIANKILPVGWVAFDGKDVPGWAQSTLAKATISTTMLPESLQKDFKTGKLVPRPATQGYEVAGRYGRAQHPTLEGAVERFRNEVLFVEAPQILVGKVLRRHRPLTMTSVSQAILARDCARRWWFRYGAGIRVEQQESASYGSQVHAAIEAWVEKGEPPAAIPQAWDVIVELNLDDRSKLEGAFVEHKLAFAIPGTRLTGDGASDLIDLRGLLGRRYRVRDIKTGKNPRKYGKTEMDLQRDLQLGVYAYLFFTSPDYKGERPKKIWFEHVNAQSIKPFEVFTTAIEVSWRTVVELWEEFVRIVVEEILEYGLYPDPSCVPANPGEACRLYPPQGCPYGELCGEKVMDEKRGGR